MARRKEIHQFYFRKHEVSFKYLKYCKKTHFYKRTRIFAKSCNVALVPPPESVALCLGRFLLLRSYYCYMLTLLGDPLFLHPTPQFPHISNKPNFSSPSGPRKEGGRHIAISPNYGGNFDVHERNFPKHKPLTHIKNPEVNSFFLKKMLV